MKGAFATARVLLSFCPLLLASRARAAPDGPAEPDGAPRESAPAFPVGWLDWSGPPECPGPDQVETRLVEWLGAPPSASLGLAVQSRVTWLEDGWEVHVVVRLGERSGERRVRLQSCGDAADFVALAVALAVNPDLEPGVSNPPDWVEPTLAPPSSTSSAEELSPLAEVETEPEAPSEPEPVDEPPVAARTFALLAGAAVEASVGALPGLHGGAAVQLGVAGERWQAWLAGRFLPVTSEVFDGAATPIEFSLLAARLAASFDLLSGPVRLGPGASFELGALQAGQTSGSLEPPQVSALWAALGAFMEVALPIEDWLLPFAAIELSVPLTRPHFVLDDGTLVHQPEVGLRAEMGARILLWAR